MAQCSICTSKGEKENTYIGQTFAESVRKRFNGHRDKFKIYPEKSYSKSALSQHCFDEHPDYMDLSYFNVGFIKRCPALDLDREENRLVSMFRTNVLGINRIKIVR